jgi:hypothetical protein
MNTTAPRKTFSATVTSNTLQKSRKKGTPSVAIAVMTKNDISNPGTEEKLSLYGHLYLTPGAIERSLKTLDEVFGWKGNDISELAEPILEGIDCNVVVEFDDEFPGPDGEPFKKIVFFNRPSRGIPKLPEEELSELTESVNELLTRHREVGEKGDEAPLPAEPAGQVDDDLPF